MVMNKAGKNKISRVRSPATWRIKEKCRPISEQPIGDYLQIAIKNMVGNSFGRSCMSFEKPFKLEADRLISGPKDLSRALHLLSLKYILTEKR